MTRRTLTRFEYEKPLLWLRLFILLSYIAALCVGLFGVLAMLAIPDRTAPISPWSALAAILRLSSPQVYRVHWLRLVSLCGVPSAAAVIFYVACPSRTARIVCCVLCVLMPAALALFQVGVVGLVMLPLYFIWYVFAMAFSPWTGDTYFHFVTIVSPLLWVTAWAVTLIAEIAMPSEH
jgi:hypothetical protein